MHEKKLRSAETKPEPITLTGVFKGHFFHNVYRPTVIRLRKPPCMPQIRLYTLSLFDTKHRICVIYFPKPILPFFLRNTLSSVKDALYIIDLCITGPNIYVLYVCLKQGK